ncbi:MAG: hypothetical protein D4R43_02410, partial [Sphingobacteriales bacterium]
YKLYVGFSWIEKAYEESYNLRIRDLRIEACKEYSFEWSKHLLIYSIIILILGRYLYFLIGWVKKYSN